MINVWMFRSMRFYENYYSLLLLRLLLVPVSSTGSLIYIEGEGGHAGSVHVSRGGRGRQSESVSGPLHKVSNTYKNRSEEEEEEKGGFRAWI